MITWALASPFVSGIYNVGTGSARSFRELIEAAYRSLGKNPDIAYIDMPEQIRDSYQYFTQSSVERLYSAGYNGGFTALETAVDDYVTRFLSKPDPYR